MFETETMAELCMKQGLTSDAVAIYGRLVAAAPDEATRARRARRLAELKAALRPPAPPAPASRQDHQPPGLRAENDGRDVTFEWRLPAGTRAPALQILVLRRDESGIAAERRTVRVDGACGRLTLPLPGIHSLRAAAGMLDGERFVPLCRLDH
jgi:hypothetical protein